MVYIALGELVVIGLLIWVIARITSESAQRIVDVISSNEAERAELLTRIQRPEFIPARQGARIKREPSKDAGNLAKIGTIAQPPQEAA